ncbi:Cof-type HAD-IIB family hydrolase [Sphingomonas aracearum]|uniref:HAD family hydrolase n=1 Tax=Sphingomonas aracearum TaxID=2283317 RepID=A0A369VY79_9SPHN|nr:Cof-type HAD-IIB family hydrolase [Sphingomonas aracearum]RDE07083.1 HAD family hydrolase [Sphingomonas aracearum]
MTGPVQLLISDIDGTLVRDDKSLSDGVVAAVRRVVEAGVPVSLISARPPSGMQWIAEKLGIDGPFGAFNGGTLFEADGTIVSAERLGERVAQAALDLLDRPEVTRWLFADGRWYAEATDNPHNAREIQSANQEPVVGAEWKELLGKADKIVGVCDDHDLLAALEQQVADALGREATVARSQPYYLDITAPQANKGDGIARLAATYGVPLEAVAVLGDQRNDLPMFARAGLSVAMGQAPDEVRAAATHVARSNEEDGVADAIDRFVLVAAEG